MDKHAAAAAAEDVETCEHERTGAPRLRLLFILTRFPGDLFRPGLWPWRV
jgi:hypothetical protein